MLVFSQIFNKSVWSLSVCVNLPRAERPHKLSDPARRQLVRGTTKTPMTTLKELKASTAEMGERLHTATVARVLHQSSFVAEFEMGRSSPQPDAT